MSNFVKAVPKGIWERWKEELWNFSSSRKELLKMKEFKIALAITAVPAVMGFFLLFVPKESSFFILLALILCIAMMVWFIWLGFITVWELLFDNIPVLSNVTGAIDNIDGLGIHKMKFISTVLKKKEEMENKITSFLRWILMLVTVTLFGKAKNLAVNSLRDIFRRFKFAEGFSWLFMSVMLVLTPLFFIFFCWVFWIW